MKRKLCLVAIGGLSLWGSPVWADSIKWQPWTDSLFVDSKKNNKLVILDLEAIWCHWCHVMDEKTYSDPKVQEIINKNFIAVRVDQDSRPDLSNRYEDYGWPATIIFDSSGKELAKRSGYIDPNNMAKMLQAFVDDPTPGPSAENTTDDQTFLSKLLTDPIRLSLQKEFLATYDDENGGWGFSHKFLDMDTLEYGLISAAKGDDGSQRMVQRALKENLALIDPVWGGVYQYSTGGRWNEPHFEKIMSFQANNLRIYSQAFALWNDPIHLKAAHDVYKFFSGFLLAPNGAFYTSQDADIIKGTHSSDYFALSDTDRRKEGIPAIDQHIYSRENGWAIEALTDYYSVTHDESVLKKARGAADWILKHRSLENGGFSHDEKDSAGPYLGDSLAMARAFLSLYKVTADPIWLKRAKATADFIVQNFLDKEEGFLTSKSATAGFKPKPQRDENISAVRFFNLLAHYTGNTAYRNIATHEFRVFPAIGTLLMDMELTEDPMHITILGPKNSPKTSSLFSTTLAAFPMYYKRIEILDRSGEPLMNDDVQYPELDQPAAFVCANRRCSLPIFDNEKLRTKLISRKKVQ